MQCRQASGMAAHHRSPSSFFANFNPGIVVMTRCCGMPLAWWQWNREHVDFLSPHICSYLLIMVSRYFFSKPLCLLAFFEVLLMVSRYEQHW